MPARIARIGVLALAFIALNPPLEANASACVFGRFIFDWRCRVITIGGGWPVPKSPRRSRGRAARRPCFIRYSPGPRSTMISFGRSCLRLGLRLREYIRPGLRQVSAAARVRALPVLDSAGEIVMRISREVVPTAVQKPLLEKLATALGQANGYLIKSCPSEIPSRPVARLVLMEHQIDATIMALQIVRPPSQEFAQSLDDAQRAQFNGPPPSAATVAGSCKPSTAAVKRLLTQLDQAVQPTDAQRPATAAVADAFDRAAREFDVNCRGAVPPTALGRLDATVARLDATWRAVQIIEAALANLQKDLNDEQNTRFNALEIAGTR